MAFRRLFDSTNITSQTPEVTEKKPGIFGRVSNFISGAENALAESIPGKIVGGAVGAAGAVAGAGWGTLLSPLAVGAKIIRGEGIGEAIGHTVQDIGKTAAETAGFGYETGKQGFAGFATAKAGKIASAVSSIPMLSAGVEDIKGGKIAKGAAELGVGAFGAYGGFKGESFGKTLSETNGIFSKAAKTTSETVRQLPSSTLGLAKSAGSTFTDLRDPAIKIQKTVNSNKASLQQVIDSNAPLRKLVSKANADGFDVHDIVSNSDLLVGSTDKSGTMRTKVKGGASEKVKAYNDSNTAVVRDNLVREDRTVSIDDIEGKINSDIESSSIKGADKKKAFNKAKQEIAALREKADSGGNVPVVEIHDLKTYKGKNIDYSKPSAANAAKVITHTLKTLVEDNTDLINVKELNNELAKGYTIQRFIDMLDGKKVSGGKLGKYGSKILGGMVGGHFGPFGVPIGAEIAEALSGKRLASNFSKETGLKFNRSARMTSALDQAKTAPPPKSYRLGLPAPDATKTGPAIPLRGPTVVEPRAKTVSGAGQTPTTADAMTIVANQNKPRRLELPEPTGTTGAPIPLREGTTYEPQAKIVGTVKGEIVPKEDIKTFPELEKMKQLNEADTKKLREEVLAGKHEDRRLDTAKKIKELFGKSAKPTDTIEVHRAAKGEIKLGDQVTIDKDGVSMYQKDRPGSTVFSKKVQLKNLVMNNGKKGEFVYAPKSKLKK